MVSRESRVVKSADGTVRVKSQDHLEAVGISWLSSVLVFLAYLVVGLTWPVSLFYCFKVVAEYERAVIFRLGRLRSGAAKGPGLFFTLPCLDHYRCVEMRTSYRDIPPQQILTRDSVTVTVDGVVFYRVSNPLKAICTNKDYVTCTMLLARTMLRNVLGTRSLAEISSEREAIAENLHADLALATSKWGVYVEKVEINDVKLPYELMRAMAAEAEATREARAKVIHAHGEKNSVAALKKAADMLASSPVGLHLRFLQEMDNMAMDNNQTLVFPLDIEIMRKLKQTLMKNKKKL